MDRVDWAGLSVFMLAAAIAVGIVAGIVDLVIVQKQIPPAATDLLSTVSGAAIGVIGVYVGQRQGWVKPPAPPAEDDER